MQHSILTSQIRKNQNNLNAKSRTCPIAKITEFPKSEMSWHDTCDFAEFRENSAPYNLWNYKARYIIIFFIIICHLHISCSSLISRVIFGIFFINFHYLIEMAGSSKVFVISLVLCVNIFLTNLQITSAGKGSKAAAKAAPKVCSLSSCHFVYLSISIAA